MPVKCEVCGQVFGLNIQLAVHRRVSHPNGVPMVPPETDKQNKSPRSAPVSNDSPNTSKPALPRDLPLKTDPDDAPGTNKLLSVQPEPAHSTAVLVTPNKNRSSTPNDENGGQTNSVGTPAKAPSSTSQAFQSLGQLRKSTRRRDVSHNRNDAIHRGSTVEHTVPHACLQCKKVISNRKNLILHLRKYHAETIRVEEGTATFGTLKGDRATTVIIRRKSSLLKRWSCKKCGKKFSELKSLWKHRLNKCGLCSKYKCPYCSLEFRFSFRWYQHRLTHSGAALKINSIGIPISSDQVLQTEQLSQAKSRGKQVQPDNFSVFISPCSTTIGGNNVLDSHSIERSSPNSRQVKLLTKKGIPQINQEVASMSKCQVPACLKIFPDMSLLSKHILESHQVYKCLYCESVLLTEIELNAHVKKRHQSELNPGSSLSNEHSQSEKYHFKSKSATAGQEFVCNTCIKTYTSKSDLDTHKAACHEINPLVGGPSSKSSEAIGGQNVHAENLTGAMEMESLNSKAVQSFQGQGAEQNKPTLKTCDTCQKSYKFRNYILHKRDCKGKALKATCVSSRKTFETNVQRNAELRENSATEAAQDSPKPNVGSKRTYNSKDVDVDASASGLQVKIKRVSLLAEGERKCIECNVVFRTSRQLQQHLEKDVCKKRNYEYQCDECPQGFSRETSLRNHKKSQHSVSDCDESENEEGVHHHSTVVQKQGRRGRRAKVFGTRQYFTNRAKSDHTRGEITAPSQVHLGRMTGVLPNRNPRAVADKIEEGSKRNGLSSQDQGYKEIAMKNVAVITPKQQTRPQQQADSSKKCNECNKEFSSKSEFIKHLLWHNEVRGSPKIFRGLRKTGVSQSPAVDLIVCVICGGGFRSRVDMVTHVKSQHSRKGMYACMECNKSFHAALDLVDHSIIHDEEFIQQMSQEVYEEQGEEESYEEEEEEETPEKEEEEDTDDDGTSIPKRDYARKMEKQRAEKIQEIKCTKCPLRFSDNHTFRIHWQSHNERGSVNASSKPQFKCASCGQNFETASLLLLHRKQEHPKDNKIICNQCGAPFVHKLGLNRHIRDHHGK